MLSAPKKLLLIGLSALVPAVAQATFIKNDVWSAGQTGFSRTIDFGNLFESWVKTPNQDTKQSWNFIGSANEISQRLSSKKNFDFDFGGQDLSGLLNDKGKKAKHKRKDKHEPSVSVPEPGTVALLALGLAGLGVSRRGEQQRSK